jgi:hypothetical protein
LTPLIRGSKSAPSPALNLWGRLLFMKEVTHVRRDPSTACL